MHAPNLPTMLDNPLAERLLGDGQRLLNGGGLPQEQDRQQPDVRARRWPSHPSLFSPFLQGHQRAPAVTHHEASRTPVLSLRIGGLVSDPAQARPLRDEVLAAIIPALHPDQPRPGALGTGSMARVQVQLDPARRGFGEAAALLGNGGSVAVRTSRGTFMVPVVSEAATLPQGAIQLLLEGIPVEWSVTSLPSQLLSFAGYRTALSPSLETGAVRLLRTRLGRLRSEQGGLLNASVMMVDLMPPPDDPFLRHLPHYFPLPSGERLYTQVRGDPLLRSASPASARPAAPAHSAPSGPAVTRREGRGGWDMTCACCRNDMQGRARCPYDH